MISHIHVVGAGMSGLAAAVRLSDRPDLGITIWEATQRAGGRCWSFHDSVLDRTIDNGNHLVLSGNMSVLDYARRIGAKDRLAVAAEAAFPFVDIARSERWTVRIPARLGEVLREGTGLPGPFAPAILDLLRLLRADGRKTVAETIRRRGALWHRFWDPMTRAVLNEPPERGAAAVLARVLRETVLRGAASSRPVFAPYGLGPALVDPAVDLLQRRGATFRWRSPLRSVERREGRLRTLRFRDGDVELGKGDIVIVAAAQAAEIATARPGPQAGQTILNAHFRVPPEDAARFPPALGVIAGTAQWIFRRDDVLSVTISAAQAARELPRDDVLDRIWHDVRRVAGNRGLPCLASRLISVPNATWDQSPDGIAHRHPGAASLANLDLAGDYLAGDLPCSIEMAVRSGEEAASRIAARLAAP